MEKHSTHILDDHGDLLGGWSLRIHTWTCVLSTQVGITGERPRTKEVLAFTSTSKFLELNNASKD